MRKLVCIIFIISGILFPQKNDVDKIDGILDTAKEHYQKENWKNTIKTLEGVLPVLNNADKITAYKYLAFSYARLNDRIAAKEHFKILLKLNPKFKLNKEDVDSSIIAVLNDAKKEIAQESAICSCFIPGSGQMIKGEDKKGKLILLSSSLTLASSIYLWLETENRKVVYLSIGPDSVKYMDKFYNEYNRWFRISLLSSSVFAGLYLYSIMDALLINTKIEISKDNGNSLYLIPELQTIKVGYKIKL